MRLLAIGLAVFFAGAVSTSAQVVYERQDPDTGRTIVAWPNGDGSLTYEVYDPDGVFLYRGIHRGSADRHPYRRRHVPRERATTPVPEFGVPVPTEPNRVVRNPYTGGTLQSHPNPGGTRTVVEVDPHGNVRTYVVPGGP